MTRGTYTCDTPTCSRNSTARALTPPQVINQAATASLERDIQQVTCDLSLLMKSR